MRALYRIFDDEARLLYVGQSTNPTRRLGAHIERQEWRYAVAYQSVTWVDDADIDDAERHAIATERPLFNLEYQPSSLTVGRSRRAAEDEAATLAVVEADVRGRTEAFRIEDVVDTTGLGKYAVRAVVGNLIRAGVVGRVGGGYQFLVDEQTKRIDAQLRTTGMTRTAIAREFGISQSAAAKKLDGCVQKGFFIRVDGRYFIPPDTSDTDGRTPVSETGRTGYVVRPVVPAPRTLDQGDN